MTWGIVLAAGVFLLLLSIVLVVRSRTRGSFSRQDPAAELVRLHSWLELLQQDARRGFTSTDDCQKWMSQAGQLTQRLDELRPRCVNISTLSNGIDTAQVVLQSTRRIVSDYILVKEIERQLSDLQQARPETLDARLDRLHRDLDVALDRIADRDVRQQLDELRRHIVLHQRERQPAREERHALNKRYGSMLDAMTKAAPPASSPSDDRTGQMSAVTETVQFTVTAPPVVEPASSFVIDLWMHVESQRQEVIRRAGDAASGRAFAVRSKGPIEVARGAVVTVRISIAGMSVATAEDTILWQGGIGTASFVVDVPADAWPRSCAGTATFFVNGDRIATLNFEIRIGAAREASRPLPSTTKPVRSAFASYASEDKDEVLNVVLGLEKGNPGLQVFFAEKELRAGERWQERLWAEIEARDVFYLFWSEAASRSPWVDREWRCAYERRGIDFIDPVPLVSPDTVRPPAELGDELHFNHWVTAYKRRSQRPAAHG